MTNVADSPDRGTTSHAFDLPDRIRELARREPNRTALIHVGRFRTRTTTYRTLSDRAEAVAVGLRELGEIGRAHV